MPEAGYLPIPAKLAKAGVKDMVRISDARMSGTAYGTIVLHVAPDAASGGPLGAGRATATAFASAFDDRKLELLVDPSELERRRTEWRPPAEDPPPRGYSRLYHEQVLQADEGCDFRFLKPAKA